VRNSSGILLNFFHCAQVIVCLRRPDSMSQPLQLRLGASVFYANKLAVESFPR